MKMFKKIQALFQSEVSAPPTPPESKRSVWETAAGGDCPVCLGTGTMRVGPSGGVCTNVACVVCGSRLNLSFQLPGWIEWTHGPTDPSPTGDPQTVFPPAEQVEKIRRLLEA